MKIFRYRANGRIKMGIKLPSGSYNLTATARAQGFPLPLSRAALRQDRTGFSLSPSRIQAIERTEPLDEQSLVFAPCVRGEGKIICIGLNYRKHAEETGLTIPSEPVVFSKFSNALAAHGQQIYMPSAGVEIDYEAELVIVMGRTAKDVPVERALEYVFGYTVGNDLSIRDLQFKTGQWLIGKTADGFAPVGPYVVPRNELDPQNLNISSRVNGETRQSSNTRDMIFSCEQIISHLSRHMTLAPGDLIFTGTPAGVAQGYPQGQRPWLKPGDRVVCEIEGIGALENRIIRRD